MKIIELSLEIFCDRKPSGEEYQECSKRLVEILNRILSKPVRISTRYLFFKVYHGCINCGEIEMYASDNLFEHPIG